MLGWIGEALHGRSDSGAPVPKGDAFEILGNDRRRAVLRYMKEREGEGPHEIGDIAEHVAAWEEGLDGPRDLSAQQRQNVYVPLYQAHLPRMDDAGVIEYDQDRGTVVVLPGAETLWALVGDSVGEPEPYLSP